MRSIFLKIYDFLEKHKAFGIVFLLLLFVLFAFFATRIKYEEDISKFLPNSKNDKYSSALEQIKNQKTIAIFFSYKKDSANTDAVTEAIQYFEEVASENDGLINNLTTTIDQTQFFDLIEAAYSHIPYLLEDEDYDRIDSLINTQGFIENQLIEDKKLLMLPSAGTFARNLAYDPLFLYSPALQKLRDLRGESSFITIDDYIFTADSIYGIVTFETPFGANETKNNARLSSFIDNCLSKVSSSYPDIETTTVGAPLIAVANAQQIKKDSIMAILIAVVLIFIILMLHYRRFSDILWVVVSLLFGVLFALAGISLIKDSVSIIVIGVGSVIIGIAANYPLHFLDDYKELGDKRKALSEMVLPLLIGNLTTVAAFFCLIWLKAQAMRDLGIFGSLMLIGTIIFVLVFLPQFITKRPHPSEHKILGKISNLHISRSKIRYYIAFFILAITIFLGYFSTKTSFDSNLSNINYMTPQQRENLQLLAQLQSPNTMYAVAEGEDLQDAVNNNQELLSKIKNADPTANISGIGEFLPSEDKIQEATEKWNSFWTAHERQEFLKQFEYQANKQGFAITAFYPFTSILNGNLEAPAAEDFNDFIQPFVNKYIFFENEKCTIISDVVTEHSDLLHKNVDNESENYFVYSNSDLGNRMVEMLSDSFNYIGWVCSIVVFVFLILSFRKLEIAIIAFLPLAVAWLWILGIMHLTGIQFNIVNIILATLIFGQGDDYTIFITEGLLYEYSTKKPRLSSYKHSIFISALIMFAGIGCLIVAKHPALHSLAVVTIIGMLTVVVMAAFIPPFLFDLLTKKKGQFRKIPISIFGFLKSAWFGLEFAFVALFIMLPYTVFNSIFGNDSEESKLKLHKKIQKYALFFAKHTPGVQFSVNNKINEQFEKPSVIISNHQSHLDILYLLSLSPKIVFLTNDWVWNFPLYRRVIREAEFYPVSNGYEQNLPKLKELFERGYSICVFPEGTRSPECEILRFHKGAFTLARELDADIIPIILHGAGYVLPKDELLLGKGFVTLEVGDRVRPYEQIEVDDEQEIDRVVAKQIRSLYKNKYSEISKQLETEQYWEVLNKSRDYYKITV